MEFHARPEFYGDRLAVGRSLVAQRQLRHDVELLVDVEQLVADGGEHDATHVGARERGVEHVRVLGKPDAQRRLGQRRAGDREKRGKRREPQDLHGFPFSHSAGSAGSAGRTVATPARA